MGDDTRPEPKLHKIIVIYDGNVPCFAAFADAEQEKKILEILNEPRRKIAQ